MMLSEAYSPHEVIVAIAEDAASRLEARAREGGAHVIEVDLAGVSDRSGLVARLSQAFMFPVPETSIDGAIDWMSDLDWIASAGGYLVRVDGLDDLPRSVIEVFSSILPAIIDRWRTRGMPFAVLLVGRRHRDVAMSALEKANAEMEAQGQLPWAQPGTGPVSVVGWDTGIT